MKHKDKSVYAAPISRSRARGIGKIGRLPQTRLRSKAGELVDQLGEACPLLGRQVGGLHVEFVVLEPGRLGEGVPGGGFGEVLRQRFAPGVEMSDAVLGDRIAPGGSGEKDLGRAGLVSG